MRYRRYPAYKDSGVEWLGEVPSHWVVDRLKWTVEGCINGVWGDEPDGDNDLVCIRVADFDRVRNRVADREYTYRSILPQQRNGRLLRPGDLLIEKSGGGEQQPVGVVVLFDYKFDAVSSNFVARMPVRAGMNSNYLCYLHSALYSMRLNTCSIKQNTGIQNLDSTAYLDEKVALPPIEDQNTIAAYLDRETAKIDALIAKQERLIALLQEKRQALISHVVTKGLNPAAPMKDSGVEWLGDVPAHWEVVLVKRHFQVELGKMLDLAKQNGTGTRKPYLRAANIHWDRLKLDDVNEMEFSDAQMERYRLDQGDLLVTEGGVTVGRSALWNGELSECYYQNSLNRVRTLSSSPLTTRYLLYWMNFTTNVGYVDLVADKATFGHLTNEKLKAFPLVAPCDKEEVDAIVSFLDSESARISAIIAKANDTISMLRERRAALISAAVTGKIDVRDQMN